MANRKISELSNLAELTGNEKFVLAKGVENYQVSPETLKEFTNKDLVPEVYLTQAEYDALVDKDPNVKYLIFEE